ncbi:MAG: ABC transporter ATP-binding protein, partial [Planctomycetota bacterium]
MASQTRSRARKRFFHYLGQVRGAFAFSLVLLVAIAGLTAAKAWIIAPVVDGHLGNRSWTQVDLYLLGLIVVGIFTAQAACNWIYIVVARMASAGMVRSIRQDLFDHLMRHSLGYFSENPSSDLTSRVVNDIALFENAAVGAVQALFRDVVTVACLMAVIISSDLQLALTCIGVILAVGLVLRTAARRLRVLGRRSQEKLSGVARQLTEMIGGVELVLSFGLAGRWRSRFEEVNEAYYRNQVDLQRTSAMSVGLVLLIIGIGFAVILVLTGGALLAGRITEGELGTLLAAFYLMQAPAQSISSAVSNIARGFAAGGRAMELMDVAPAIEDPAHPGEPKGPSRIGLEGVSFAYRDTPVVRRLSFEVEPGELVVMVGDSGAGKSTVAKLMLRFYDPREGEVRLGGVPLPQLSRATLYRHVSYVGQDVYLFDATVAFNVRIGKPPATDAEVGEAIRIACVDDFLSELPDGLETVVGERGVRLSGGQRQRIAIARAVLSDSSVLVFDEATSALDMDLEQRILQNLVDLGRRRTIFAITHRLTMAEIADRVLVLKEGELVEEGRAESLAEAGGEFARLKRAA